MRLFGSALPRHQSLIHIKIREATTTEWDDEQHYMGSDVIAECYLSAAQWAEFLTSMNVGDGVPCTLGTHRGSDGKMVDPGEPPEEETPVTRAAKHAVQATEDDFTQAHRDMVALLAEVDADKRVPRAVKDRIKDIARRLGYGLDGNLRFRVERVQEAAAKAVAAAKAEVDAFMTHAIHRAGLSALRGERVEPLALPRPKED
jgi:hypothetical protein